jgi:hypothetical protein
MKQYDLKTLVILTERDIITLKSRLNNNKERIESFNFPYNVTIEQSNKGIEFLRKRYFKKNGGLTVNAERELENKEIEILRDFDHFEFNGWYDGYNGYRYNYQPIYRVYAKDNNYYFDYYYDFNGLHII